MEDSHHCVLPPYHRRHRALVPPRPGATIFERLRFWARKTTLVSAASGRRKLAFRSSNEVEAERRRHLDSPWAYIIHPLSNFRVTWIITMLIVLAVAMVHFPFYGAFHTSISQLIREEMALMGYFLDLIALSDIIINFFTGYRHPATGEFVLEPKRIKQRYLLGGFTIDLLTTLPLKEIVHHSVTTAGVRVDEHMDRILDSLLIIKMLRIRLYFVYTRELTEIYMINSLHRGISTLVATSLYYIHLMGCLHYMVPTLVHAYGGDLPKECWLCRLMLLQKPISIRYLYSVRRAYSIMASMMYGRYETITIEDAFLVILNTITGNLVLCYYLVLVMSIFTSASASSTKFFEILNQTRAYMRHKQFPLTMQNRLLSYYDYRFHKKYYHEKAILATLPGHLADEIMMYSCQRMIQKAKIFDKLPPKVIASIVAALKPEVLFPKDVVIRAGSKGDCMFFLSSGRLAMISRFGKEEERLKDGDHFGEIALVMSEERQVYTYVALEICDVYRLNRRDFRRLVASSPELYHRIEEVARQRVERSLELEEQNKQGQHAGNYVDSDLELDV